MKKRRYIVFGIVLALGFVLRIILSRLGHNYDLESYWIVGEIVAKGGNVYAETHRYNYGPIWFYILGVVYWFTDRFGQGFDFFGLVIAMFLSLVDIGIFYILYKKYSLLAASLFFLNPVSLIITGYHRQFDNLAIFLGLVAIHVLDRRSDSMKKVLVASLILGLSITIKHVFFLLPIWLFFADEIKGLKSRLLLLFIPFILFFASFLPFWAVGSSGIIQNVFLYKSFNNAPFWFMFAPAPLYDLLASKKVFIVLLVMFGFLLRKLSIFKLTLVYLICLVTFSPAIANQYLAIPLSAMAAYPNFFFVLYSYLTTVLLLKDQAALGITFLSQYSSQLPLDRLVVHTSVRAYDLIILMCLFGLIVLLKNHRLNSFKDYKSWMPNLLDLIKL